MKPASQSRVDPADQDPAAIRRDVGVVLPAHPGENGTGPAVGRRGAFDVRQGRLDLFANLVRRHQVEGREIVAPRRGMRTQCRIEPGEFVVHEPAGSG